MPKIKLTYASADLVPAELKAYAGTDHSVEIWTGASQDAVAAELNPSLEQNRNALKSEKDQIQTKYNSLLTSSADTARQLQEANIALATNVGVPPEDLKLLNTVKSAAPNMKAEDIKNVLTNFPQVSAELNTLKTDKSNADFFASTGYKNEKVFLDLLGNTAKNPNLKGVEAREETVDGKPVKKPYAKVKQADGSIKDVPFSDYVKDNSEWAPYVPVLGSNGEQSSPWIVQTGAKPEDNKATAPGDFLKTFIETENKAGSEKPNALKPAASSTSDAIQN